MEMEKRQPQGSSEGAAGGESLSLLEKQPPECHRWCRMTTWLELHQGEGSLLTELMTGP